MAADPQDVNLQWAVLGRQIELLFAEPIGQYLVERATTEREQALEALMRADATNVSQMTALQMKARVAERALGWLVEAVKAGEQAAEHLDGAHEP